MKRADSFKPLWRIHNKTYRHYAKDYRFRRVGRYMKKLMLVLRLALQRVSKRRGEP